MNYDPFIYTDSCWLKCCYIGWYDFRGGQWNSGGQCHKETEPISDGKHLRKYPSKMRALERVVMPKMKTSVIYMNISRLTDYRKDGHPSIYRMEYKTAEEQASAELHQDCSHWCLPGVPDTWNELLYASLLKYGKGHWKSWAIIYIFNTCIFIDLHNCHDENHESCKICRLKASFRYPWLVKEKEGSNLFPYSTTKISLVNV